MTERDLPTLLRELDAALDEHPELDPATRALVADVRKDLDRVLATSEPDDSFRARLADAVAEFEKSHPALVEATQRVLDQLANLGV